MKYSSLTLSVSFLLFLCGVSSSFGDRDSDSGVCSFSSQTTAEEVAFGFDLTDRRFFITGANSGIGFETARVLYNAGATVLLACRNAEKMASAKSRLEAQKPSEWDFAGRIETIRVDLSSQASVRRCAEEFLSRRDSRGEVLEIDSFVANAGVMDVPFDRTEELFELTMSANYFGHFSLVGLLLERVTRRIVLVSSMAHHMAAPLDVANLNFDGEQERNYDGHAAYCQSKLAMILFANELNRRLSDSPREVFSLHPGVISTELGRYSARTRELLADYADKNVSQGASTTLYAVLHETLTNKGGGYLSDCAISEPSGQASSVVLQEELFRQSEHLTGVQFQI